MRSHEIAERIGDSFSRGWALTYLGMAYVMREDWTEAVETSEAALQLARETRTGLEGEPWKLGTLSDALRGAGDAAGARERAEEGVTIALDHLSESGLAYCYRALGEALHALGGADAAHRAEDALAEAEAAARRTGALNELPYVEAARKRLVVA
jgi:tetratricopeptide (TPR) repeat protein